MATACILLTDITGSTSLYEQVGQREALQHISQVLLRMREIIEENNGHCVKTQGDDTLSFFARPDHGFHAAHVMLEEPWPFGLSVHAGLFHGDVMQMDNDIYGDAVNMAARLTSLAKSGELLVGDVAFDGLSPDNGEKLQSIGKIKLKGKSEATRVYSYMAGLLSGRTVFAGKGGALSGRRTESAEFKFSDQVWRITEGQALSIGRSEDCDICLPEPWISRNHGKLELRGSQLEYTDHSSTGSSVAPQDGPEFAVHRRGTLLNGEGVLYFGTRDRAETNSALSYATNDLIPD